MPIDPINGNSSSFTSDRMSEMTSDDFLKIMFAELANQDPTQPQDSETLVNQINTIRSIESNTQLTQQLTQLVTESKFATAGTLVGKSVIGVSEFGELAEGQVYAVGMEATGIMLTLADGTRMPYDSLHSVYQPAPEDDTNTETDG